MKFCTESVLLYFFILSFTCGWSTTCPCVFEKTIDITSGKIDSNNAIVFENTLYKPENYYSYNNRTYGCVCNVKTCVPKCCPEKHMFRNKTCEYYGEFEFTTTPSRGVNLSDSTEVHFFEQASCVGEKVFLTIEDIFGIYANGNVELSFLNITDDIHKHCIEANEDPVNLTFLFCLDQWPEPTKVPVYTSIGMIISMPFLLATFLVYALLPDRNLPAKALMCYVLSLLFAYILLVTIQLNNLLDSASCKTLAFFCYFFFMASFFWMNASCLDIFFTFSGIRGLLGEKKKENRRFMYYSAYAWGVPVLMVGFAAIFTFEKTDNLTWATGIGEGQCWFRNGWPTGIYFYFPIATLLIVNIVLFSITTYKIKRVQRDTKMLKNVDSRKNRKYDNNDKQRFNLYVKLLFAMGINWSMEVISWAIMWRWSNVPEYVWVLTDFCNAVYGVFIFFIFVFKRNIWMMLKKRYLQFTGRPQQAHTLTSVNRTTVSQVSSSEA